LAQHSDYFYLHIYRKTKFYFTVTSMWALSRQSKVRD